MSDEIVKDQNAMMSEFLQKYQELCQTYGMELHAVPIFEENKYGVFEMVMRYRVSVLPQRR